LGVLDEPLISPVYDRILIPDREGLDRVGGAFVTSMSHDRQGEMACWHRSEPAQEKNCETNPILDSASEPKLEALCGLAAVRSPAKDVRNGSQFSSETKPIFG
jgi:hypothetical protein